MALHGLAFGVLTYAASQPDFLTVGFAVRAGDANGAVSQERHARHLQATFDTQLAATPSPPTVVASPVPPTLVELPTPPSPPVAPPREPATAANLDHQPVVPLIAARTPATRTPRGIGGSVPIASDYIPRIEPAPSPPVTLSPAMVDTTPTSVAVTTAEPTAVPERVAMVDGVRGLTATAAAVTVQPLESGDDDVDSIGANSPQGARVSQLPSRLPRNREPVYPEELRRQQIGGTVLLRVTISSDGAAEVVTLAKSSGYKALDDSALEAVRTWRFEPARRNKIAVRYTVKLPITFTVRAG